MKFNDSSLNLGGAGLVLRNSAVQQNPSVKKLSDTYNEFAKLVFLFDVSGSMCSPVAYDSRGSSYADQYVWHDDVVLDIKNRVGAAIAKANGLMFSGLDDWQDQMTQDEMECLRLRDPGRGTMGEFTFNPDASADTDELKTRILRADLTAHFGILPDITKKHQAPPSRIEIVKKLAKQEINARFKKYPASRIAVIPFASYPISLFDDGTHDQIDAALDQLHTDMPDTGGGTDIISAIVAGLEVCRKNPSQVGIHHFILVTDGEDGGATREIVGWIPNLKASGVVLDYIHIGDLTPNAALQHACKELGGEYVTVNSAKDLEQKFMAAVSRQLCAPAAAKS